MILDKQFDKVWLKLEQAEKTYDRLIFKRVQEVNTKVLVCTEHYRQAPEGEYRDITSGTLWGGSGKTGWFLGEIQITKELEGKKVYLEAETGAIEAMLFVKGVPKGIYAHRVVENNRGNHHMLFVAKDAKEGETIPFAVEAYCWHDGVGTQPFAEPDLADKVCEYAGVWVCTVNETVKDFVFNLRILNQLRKYAKDDFRKAQVEKCLWDVYGMIHQKPEEYEEEVWMAALEKACERMREAVDVKNGPGAPSAGLIGHSHMDTAWQWTIDETIRKCSRTYSNALNLMDQYDDYMFFQSSAYHGELMKRHYPSIYEEIKRRVKEGRYEPNGGAWIECDCNLVSGESFIRQFLWGQRWTKENYDYESDIFWLPDTFGYSAALPQILKGCNIRYFMTTKLMWNDTNEFPYDTFWWRGIDGTVIFSHFNDSHSKTDPESIIRNVYNRTKLKMVTNDRLVSYGFGDGGGGPSYDMVEMAERMKDVNGCPKTRHTSVSDFMHKLEKECWHAPLYAGELYLEGHRGTLTSFHDIKRNNRKAEIALHDLDFAAAMAWLAGKEVKNYDSLYETLLINQFHDILPGTCIPEVNQRTFREMKELLEESGTRFHELLEEEAEEGTLSVINTLPWERNCAFLETDAEGISGIKTQATTGVDGIRRLYACDLSVPGQGAQQMREGTSLPAEEKTPFFYDGTHLSTPWYDMVFDENGYLSSLYDKKAGRELVRKGGHSMNAFFLPEDVPQTWDNWDIDADVIETMTPVCVPHERKLVENGPMLCRIRTVFNLTEKTTAVQDMILYADRRQIDFETKVDWHEKHHLLKAGFDLDINAASARHEIQFGYMERPCFKNNNFEKAMFEVVNHKYTDISEPGFGATLLNDCKYGISVNGTQAALSLLKGGTHPDSSADEGEHIFTYSFVTHDGFNWENVIKPAYELNYPLRLVKGSAPLVTPLVECDKKNVITETIKVAEDGDGLIVRMYESQRLGGPVEIALKVPVEKVIRTNMLEEPEEEIPVENGKIRLSMRAFEIVTLKLIV